jgi:hypothetical protein
MNEKSSQAENNSILECEYKLGSHRGRHDYTMNVQSAY